MRHQPEHTTDALINCQPILADRLVAPEYGLALGLGSGDRFEGFRGGSGSFEGGVQGGDKPANLQGKRATKRVSCVA